MRNWSVIDSDDKNLELLPVTYISTLLICIKPIKTDSKSLTSCIVFNLGYLGK